MTLVSFASFASSHLKVGQLRDAGPDLFGRRAKDHEGLHQLVVLGISRKQRLLVGQLRKDGANAPHVERSAVSEKNGA